MSAYPHTDRVVDLFLARLLETPAGLAAPAQVCVSMVTRSQSGVTGEFPVTPNFTTREALEAFCKQHWVSFLALNEQIFQMGAIPTPFWQKPA
jgi:hypothetical protein